MYVRGKISDLTPIDIPEVENFITSPLNEIDYFKCQKEDLVSLRDYLLELKEQKKEYDKLIAEPLKSIQEKNTWCIDVQPATGDIFFMEAQSKNYPSVFISQYDDNFVGSGIAYDSLDPRGFIYSKRMIKRHAILKNSKDELLEIQKIIQSFGFSSDKEGLITASNHFLIVPYSFEEVHIQKKRKTSMYHIIKLNKNGEYVSNHCGMTYFDKKKSKNYADSFVKKLYLSKSK